MVGCEKPDICILPDDLFFEAIDQIATIDLGWMNSGEGGLFGRTPPLICGCCRDHPATQKGCRVCRAYICNMCLTVCSACNGNTCLHHIEYMAHKRYPQVCRDCAVKMCGQEYMSDTDEMYRLHRHDVTPDRDYPTYEWKPNKEPPSAEGTYDVHEEYDQ